MRRLMIIGTAAAFGALAASAPALADRNAGPNQQNSQCWNSQVGNSGSNAGTWGYWSACPQRAGVVVAPAQNRRARHQGSR